MKGNDYVASVPNVGIVNIMNQIQTERIKACAEQFSNCSAKKFLVARILLSHGVGV